MGDFILFRTLFAFFLVCGVCSQSGTTTTTIPPAVTTVAQTTTPVSTTQKIATTTTMTTTTTTTQATTTTTEEKTYHGIWVTGYPKSSLVNHLAFIPTTLDDIQNLPGSLSGLTMSDRDTDLMACSANYHKQEVYVFDYFFKGIKLLTNASSDPLSEDNYSEFYMAASKRALYLAVDWVNDNVYWTDPLMNTVNIKAGGVPDDVYSYKILISRHGVSMPTGIDVDPIAGYVFFTTVGMNERIYRCSLDGKNLRTIVHSRLSNPLDLAVDVLTQQIFWTDGTTFKSHGYGPSDTAGDAQSSRYDQEFRSIVVFKDTIGVINSRGELSTFDRNTNALIHMIASPSEYFQDICLYHPDVQPNASLGDACRNNGCAHMCIMNGTVPACMCYEGYTLKEDGKSCDLSTGPHNTAVVITDGLKICLMDIRILSVHDEGFQNYKDCFYTHADEDDPITHLELDMTRRIIFFSTSDRIFSIPIDSDNAVPEPLTTIAGSRIGGLSYNWITRDLYFTDVDNGDINILYLNSEDLEVLNLRSAISSLGTISVRPHENLLYYVQKTGEQLELVSSGLAGENMAVLVNVSGAIYKLVPDPAHNRMTYLEDTVVKSIAYDGESENYIHFGDWDITTYAIYQEYVIEGVFAGDRTDIYSGMIGSYIQESGTISDFGYIKDVVILDAVVLQPEETGPCTVRNGGCSHLCIPVDGKAQCRCKLGYTIDADGKSCSSKPINDNFFLMADTTFAEVLQVPLDPTIPISAFDVEGSGSLLGVMYNYLTKEIYWSSYTYDQMYAMEMNGDNKRTVLDLYADRGFYNSPDRMVLDPSTGNIYYSGPRWLSFSESHIGVLSPSGGLTLLPIDVEIESPRDIELDPKRGLMFWVDISSGSVYKAYMDGSNVKEIVTKDDVSGPAGLALDRENKIVYFTDGFNDEIYMVDYDGVTNTKLLERKDSSLEDIVLSRRNIYYSAWNEKYISKVSLDNINTTERLRESAGFGRVHSLDLWESDVHTLEGNPDCLNGNGGCSHFCLPTPIGHTCACEDYYALLSDDATCENVPRCPGYLESASLDETCLRLKGTNCKFTCNANYKRKDTYDKDYLVCNDSLAWTEPEPCQEILCPLELPNGVLGGEYCDGKIGHQCGNITCDDRYELRPGENAVMCEENGVWSEPLDTLCEEKCPMDIAFGKLADDCKRDPGDTCMFTCQDLYRPLGDNDRLTCITAYGWNRDTKTVCEEIMCPAKFQNAESLDCTNKVDSLCVYKCEPGYTKNVEVLLIKCLGDGTWSHMVAGKTEPACLETKCPMTVGDGKIVNTCDPKVGAACGVECNDGYEKVPGIPSTIACKSDGTWNANKVCQKKKCPAVVKNANLKEPCSREFGTKCIYQCRTGYKRNDKVVMITCQADGTWDHTGTTEPACLGVTCPHILPNAVLGLDCNATAGTECKNITCKEEYENKPEIAGITCNVDGTWSTSDVCRIKKTTVQKLEDHLPVIVGVSVAIFVILIIIIVALGCLLFRSRRGFSGGITGRSMKYDTRTEAVSPAGGFDNPQYVESNLGTTDNAGGTKDFGYVTLDSDQIELSPKGGKY